MLDRGVWAEVRVGREHLRLFSEHNAQGVQASVYNVTKKNWIAPSEPVDDTQGVQASVYNVTKKNWIAPSEPVDDIEHGKDRAAAHARTYLQNAGHLEMPPLEWKKSRSA